MNLPRIVPAAFVALLLSSSGMYAAQTASCIFNTFSAPSGYSFSEVDGVSDDGTVVGQLSDNNTLQLVAFMRSSSGVITKYAAPKSAATWLYGRNSTGANAGFYLDSAYPGHVHGFLLQGSKFTAVNHPNAVNSWLYDVNLLGGAVGSFINAQYVTKGFKLVNGNYTTIAYPSAQTTNAMAINDNGDVVGTYSSGLISNGFFWKNGTFTTINFPRAKYGSVLIAVNNVEVIVGNRLSADGAMGFIYENGLFKNIVYTGANYTMAGGINNNGLISGQIVLTSKTSLGYTAVCK